ncbi:hypothetical protein SO802_009220 [Lithocarpus litseifolius]|uniref:DUF3700 domain-containing protein n=1 Tax=Lithocarpus litseifolius TaxID=425828 RepID=A0AAW2DDM1_9ROSI
MLPVFDKSVAKSPKALQSPQSELVSTLEDGFLANHFGSLHPSSVTVNLTSSGLIAYSLQNKNPLLPRGWLVVTVDLAVGCGSWLWCWVFLLGLLGSDGGSVSGYSGGSVSDLWCWVGCASNSPS